ncbi:unnamed protein product [Moneuplotes crassus]|uniref:Uncharacterized protein n=1 Tax=Euplotes crassus TaxID=5936 RepID=A0AAD1Y859_EUPCR|nr:unnamed protein product [Moneuplotes crassus]
MKKKENSASNLEPESKPLNIRNKKNLKIFKSSSKNAQNAQPTKTPVKNKMSIPDEYKTKELVMLMEEREREMLDEEKKKEGEKQMLLKAMNLTPLKPQGRFKPLFTKTLRDPEEFMKQGVFEDLNLELKGKHINETQIEEPEKVAAVAVNLFAKKVQKIDTDIRQRTSIRPSDLGEDRNEDNFSNQFKKSDQLEHRSRIKEKMQRDEILKKMPAPSSLLSSISSEFKERTHNRDLGSSNREENTDILSSSNILDKRSMAKGSSDIAHSINEGEKDLNETYKDLKTKLKFKQVELKKAKYEINKAKNNYILRESLEKVKQACEQVKEKKKLSILELTRKKKILTKIKAKYQRAKEMTETKTAQQIMDQRKENMIQQKQILKQKLSETIAVDSEIQYTYALISCISCKVKIEQMNSKALCIYTAYPKFTSSTFEYRVKGLDTRLDPMLVIPRLYFRLKSEGAISKDTHEIENECTLELSCYKADSCPRKLAKLYFGDEDAYKSPNKSGKIANLISSDFEYPSCVDDADEESSKNEEEALADKNMFLTKISIKEDFGPRLYITRFLFSKSTDFEPKCLEIDMDLNKFLHCSLIKLKSLEKNEKDITSSSKSLRLSGKIEEVISENFYKKSHKNVRESLSQLHKNRQLSEAGFYNPIDHYKSEEEDLGNDERNSPKPEVPLIQKQNEEILQKLMELLSRNI